LQNEDINFCYSCQYHWCWMRIWWTVFRYHGECCMCKQSV